MIWNWTPLHISVRCQKTTSAVTPISILRQKQPPSKFVPILLEFWSECEGSGRKEEFPITNEIKLPPKTENIISLSLSLPLPFWKMVRGQFVVVTLLSKTFSCPCPDIASTQPTVTFTRYTFMIQSRKWYWYFCLTLYHKSNVGHFAGFRRLD